MEDHNARAGSGSVADLVAGGVRQHPAAVVALGVADDRLPSEFPDSAVTKNVLHTDRIDLNGAIAIHRIHFNVRRNMIITTRAVVHYITLIQYILC